MRLFDGLWSPDLSIGTEAIEAADKSLKDVAEWLGFETVGEYLDALPRERERIFERALY